MILNALSERFHLYPPQLSGAPLKEDRVVSTRVAGFQAGAAACGLRTDGRVDLAMILADEPASIGAVFTQNKLAAAPVRICRRHIASGMMRAVIANSGNANAATGQPGLDACLKTCQAAASQLGCGPEDIFPCSTGVIGKVLDAEKVAAALPDLQADLDQDGFKRAALAIRTTDASTKMAEAETVVHGQKITVVGFCKGAGMIRPDMATMLAYVMTDAAASPEALEAVARMAAAHSFNRITVDGDTSTNDTLLLMASGKAGNPRLEPDDPMLVALAEAVTSVCQDLAAMIAADGEGAGHLALLHITGAPTREAARDLCYAIGHSPLCKTALASGDPYWGRFLSAIAAECGRKGWPFEAEKTRVSIGGVEISASGMWCGQEAEDEAIKIMKQPRYAIHIELGQGPESFWLMTTDLDHDYVSLNIDYRS